MRFFLNLFLLTLIPSSVIADELPLWEFGLGAAPISFPDYRGSDERSAYVLPLPYIIYRGDRFKVDRDGPRGILFDTDRAELDISLNASIPVDSDNNNARRGMSDLDPTFEVGPVLKLKLTDPQADWPLRLDLPVRAVFATDFTDIEHVGWLFHPQLWLDAPKIAGWNVSVGAGPIFADRSYHDYYYSVDSGAATATRPAFAADGGYSGTSLLAGTSRRFGNLWIGGFLRYDNLSGASFEDSPLVETDHYFAAGFAVAWIFAQSDERVPDNSTFALE